MSRRARPANNMTKGVLDALLYDRTDLEIRGQALQRGTNAIVLPQGGATRRGGLTRRGLARKQMRRFTVTSGMVGAPVGGTIANLVDRQPTTEFRTSVAPSGATWVWLSLDLATPVTIEAVDLVRVAAQSANADNCLGIETSTDAVTWVPLGRPFNIRTATRTRRFALPPGQTRQARYVRAVIYGAPGIGTVGTGEIAIFQPTTRLSRVRKLNFTFGADQTYTLWATDRNVDVYRNGEWQAAIPIPHRAAQLGQMTRLQSGDLLLLMNGDVQPWTIFREGAHWEWNSYAQTFSNVPALAGGTILTVAQDEVQRVTIDGLGPTGVFTLEIEGVETASVTRGSDWTTLAANIKAQLEALPNVGSSVQVTIREMTTTRLVFEVRFVSGAGQRVWPPMFVDVLNNDAYASSNETVQDGRPSSGSLMSAATGWPRCGTLFQGRGLFGGFKLQPETILGSMVASFFDFNALSSLGADAGVEYSLDSEEVPIILHLFAGRHLQALTASSEWWVSDRVIDATQVTNFVNATRYGARDGVEPVQVEGRTVFAQATGDVLRAFAYSDTDQDYTAPPLSIYASHLVTDVVDVAYRRGSSTTQGSQLWTVNADGSVAVIVSLRDEKVLATTPQVTDGAVRAVCVDGNRRVLFAIERTIGGTPWISIEELDDGWYYDFATRVAVAAGQTVLTGLADYDGKTVWAMVDGTPMGPLTVSGGSLTLPRAPAAATQAEIGLWPEFVLSPMPDRFVGRDGSVRVSASRVHTCVLSLFETTSAAIAANGQPARPVPLRTTGAGLLDVAQEAAPFTGPVRIDGLLGHVVDANVEIRQLRPGRITVRSILTEVA